MLLVHKRTVATFALLCALSAAFVAVTAGAVLSQPKASASPTTFAGKGFTIKLPAGANDPEHTHKEIKAKGLNYEIDQYIWSYKVGAISVAVHSYLFDKGTAGADFDAKQLLATFKKDYFAARKELKPINPTEFVRQGAPAYEFREVDSGTSGRRTWIAVKPSVFFISAEFGSKATLDSPELKEFFDSFKAK